MQQLRIGRSLTGESGLWILVAVIGLFVEMPGSTVKEVERPITLPMETTPAATYPSSPPVTSAKKTASTV